MMQISSNFGIGSLNSFQGNRQNAPAQAAGESVATNMNPVDQLDFSSEAQAILSGEGTETENRAQKIAGIRQEIANGTYDTDEKINAALDRFLDIYG